MFTPWLKRKSLKRSPKAKSLIIEGHNPSMILLLSLAGLMVVFGVFVVKRSRAANSANVIVSPSPSATVSPSASPYETPAP
jgi:hypothetical protein